MRKIKFVVLSTLLFTCGAFTSCANNNNVNNDSDILIIGVNDVNPLFNEIDILIDNLENEKTITIDNIDFFTGNINNKKVVIADAPIGISGAAMTTTLGIKHFNPKTVISEGTSGGHHLTVLNNHIILGKDILDIASYRGDGDDPSTWQLIQPILHSDEKLLEIASKVKYDYGLHADGIIASSDVWNTDPYFVFELNRNFHEDCEEMESYGVATVCDNYDIPVLAIRIISNNLMSGQEFDPTATKNVQRFTLNVIKAI